MPKQVAAGGFCELYDCHVTSITLGHGASAKLVRTHVQAPRAWKCAADAAEGSAGAGVQGRGFASLHLLACSIKDCASWQGSTWLCTCRQVMASFYGMARQSLWIAPWLAAVKAAWSWGPGNGRWLAAPCALDGEGAR